MRIISMLAENFKRLKVFYLNPKGNVVKLSGGNGAGKSSVLDAIFLALAGARGGPSVPVRRGEDRAAVKIDLGEIVITRMWTKDGNPQGEMWIEAKDGRRYGTPQNLLDNLMGKISFDPLAFMRMTPKQQMEELRKLLDLDETINEAKAQEAVDYTTRTEQTKYLRQLEAQRLALQYPEDLPKKKYDIDAMTEELASVAKFNTDIERTKDEREDTKAERSAVVEDIDSNSEEIVRLKREIDRIEKETEGMRSKLAAMDNEIEAWKPLPTPKDAEKLAASITSARAVNAAINRKVEAEAKDAEIKRVNENIERLSTAIEGARDKQAKIIAGAKYPVPGLGFSEDEVTFNDLPFTQASNAEQIQVSIAMGMAINPKLRVMRIKDGSLLDDNAMKVLEDMAEANDFQVFVEVVDTSGKVGVYLEDGEIVAIDGEKAPAPPPAQLGAARKKPEAKTTAEKPKRGRAKA